MRWEEGVNDEEGDYGGGGEQEEGKRGVEGMRFQDSRGG